MFTNNMRKHLFLIVFNEHFYLVRLTFKKICLLYKLPVHTFFLLIKSFYFFIKQLKRLPLSIALVNEYKSSIVTKSHT